MKPENVKKDLVSDKNFFNIKQAEFGINKV